MTEIEMKNEMLEAISTEDAKQKCLPEFEKFINQDNLDGKPIIHKLYQQWKSGAKGNKNLINSWTAYYLGITSAKPEDGKEFLPRRRAFARPSPPDIDSDFDYFRRHEILEHIISKYGRYNVGNIGTYGALKMRSCLTRIIKALDIANAFKDGSQAFTTENVKMVDEILGTLPRQRGAVLKVEDSDGDEVVIKNTRDVVETDSRDCDDFRYYMDKYPEIYEHAKQIEGLLSIFGVHASGVVISDVPLNEIAPLRTAKTGGELALATQFSYDDLELLGLIKFDFLAISTLTVISETLKAIKDNFGVDLDIENLPIDPTTSIEAKRTFDLYKSGHLCGVFQCESDGMQETCRKVGVDRYEDIMAVISLYRPGPMDSIPRYVERKHGREKIDYFHPTVAPHVEEILKETYGVATYQEQLMFICEKLAGMEIGDGYMVIKGIGKKKIEIITKFKKVFVSGCVKNGVPENIANEYWEKFIVPFANYGFNKAHAAAYAYTSYITAYLKANYPEEFMISYLNVETERRKFERLVELEKECVRMGISVLPRDINKSDGKWKLSRRKDEKNGIPKSEIRPSIHCKGLASAAAESILAHRPYNSVRDFAEKVDKRVDKESLESLCDAKFFKTKKDKLVEEFMTIREDLKKLRSKGRVSRNIFDED